MGRGVRAVVCVVVAVVLTAVADALCPAGQVDPGSGCVDCNAGEYATGATAVCEWRSVPSTCSGASAAATIQTAYGSNYGTYIAGTCTFNPDATAFYNGQTNVACQLPMRLSDDSGDVTVAVTCAASIAATGDLTLACQTSGSGVDVGITSGCIDYTSGQVNANRLGNPAQTVQCAFEDHSLTSCVACPAGTECPNPTTAVIPVPCPVKEYNDLTGQGSCTICPAGKVCPNEGMTAAIDCPAGDTAAQGSEYCSDCAAGTIAASAASPSCTPCDAGTKSNAALTACEQCPVGTSSSSGSATCTDCAEGTFASAAGSATCTNCTAGYNCSGTGTVNPTKCVAGQYAPTGSAACYPCPEGTYQPADGQSACLDCPAGKSCAGTGLTTYSSCSPGQYSGYDLNPNAFDLPYDHTDSTIQPTSGTASSCQTCPAGYKCATGGLIELCPTGTTSVAGQTTCTACPAGKYCPNPLTESSCAAGTYSTGSQASCTACPAGYYCPDTTQDIRRPCVVGQYSLGGAVTACTACPAGYECPSLDGSQNAACARGTYSTGSQTYCTLCSPGHFCNDTATLAEYPCASGSYSGGTQDECTLCPAGKYGTDPSEGAIKEDNSCAKCPAGTYSNVEGAGALSACAFCPQDTYCPVAGSTIPTPCAGDTSTYGLTGQTVCGGAPPAPTAPPAPRPPPPAPAPPAPPPFAETINPPEISLRLQGSLSDWRAANETAFKAGIVSALADGTTVNDIVITSVTQGSVVVAFQITSQQMIPTAGGTWNQAYFTSAVTTISNAVSGNTLNVGATPLSGPTVNCAPGSYVSSSSGGVNVCALCAAGTYSIAVNAAQCTPCSAGKASNARGDISCHDCDPGSVAPNAGTAVCALCPRGMFQPRGGQTTCDACAENYFAGSFGSLQCQPCPSGFVSGDPAWVGETPRMRADGQLSVEVQEALDGIRCIPDGSYQLPPAPPAALSVREADATSWKIGLLSLVLFLLALSRISYDIWNQEKLNLRFAELDTFLDAMAPSQENVLPKGSLKEFEAEDLAFAVGCLRNGKIEEAAGIYRRIVDRKPNHADALHGLAVSHAFLGDLEYAFAFAKRSCAVAMTSQRRITLANIWLAEGKVSNASSSYALAIRRDPMSAVGHYNIGNAHFMLGDAVSARTSYMAAIDREPRYFKALHNLGLLMDSTGAIVEAKEWMKRAVDVRPNDARALHAMGLIYIKLGQWAKAEATLLDLIKVRPKHPDVYAKLGNLAFRRSDYERAGAYYLTALDYAPGHVEALTNLALLDWCRGSAASCNAQLRLALTIDPEYYPALYNLALTRLSQGRIEECLRYYNRAKAAMDDSPLARVQIFNLGMALAELDEIDEREVPEEITPTATESRFMKIALAKIAREDNAGDADATAASTKATDATKATATKDPAVAPPPIRVEPKRKAESNTQRVYSSLVFISDAVKFSERLENCALDDACVVAYEHDMNSIALCGKLISRAREKLSNATGLQPVDRVAIIAPTIVGGVCLGDEVVMNYDTVMQKGDVASFLTGVHELLGTQQWKGKRLDFLTLDYTSEVNIKLLRMIKYEYSFECEVSCSNKMEFIETYALTREQMQSTAGAAAGGTEACAQYFDMSKLKDWAALPEELPRHKIVESANGAVAIEASTKEASKISWRAAGKAAMMLSQHQRAVTTAPSIDPPPALPAPVQKSSVASRRKHQVVYSSQSAVRTVDIEMLTDMPAAKFRNHVTQLFFCKEVSLELGIDENRVRVKTILDSSETITIRISEKKDGSDQGPPLRVIVQNLENAIKDGYFVIDPSFGSVDVLGVYWPLDDGDDDEINDTLDAKSEVSSGDETRVSHDENAVPSARVVEFEEFDVADLSAKSGARVNQDAPTVSRAMAIERTKIADEPMSSDAQRNFVDIEYNDAVPGIANQQQSAPKRNWDLDENAKKWRGERTGIWDTR